MDYTIYYCKQAKSNQIGSGLPIQGRSQLEPSNFDFLEDKTKIGTDNIEKKRKQKSGLRKKPNQTKKKTKKHQINKKVTKKPNTKKKRKTKSKSKKKSLDIFI
jgi:hypothetical protein